MARRLLMGVAMSRIAYHLAAIAFAASLPACQPMTDSKPLAAAAHSPARPGDSIEAAIGDVAFVQAACAGCHAIRRLELSPNPEAPSFSDIANRNGLTALTLSNFLRDAHNYPEAMDFDLTAARADALTVYILSLREESYRPLQ